MNKHTVSENDNDKSDVSDSKDDDDDEEEDIDAKRQRNANRMEKRKSFLKLLEDRECLYFTGECEAKYKGSR